MSFHQILAVLSVVCFVAGGLLVGIGATLAAVKHARQDAEKMAYNAIRRDAVA